METSASSFYVTGGTLRHDAACYVERQADRDLCEGLRRSDFCYVLTARQMGKSSLMVRTAARLRQEGAKVVVLDLTAIGQNLTPEQWYGGLIMLMGSQLGLEDELEDYWHGHTLFGPCQRFFAALRDVALGSAPVSGAGLGVSPNPSVSGAPLASSQNTAHTVPLGGTPSGAGETPALPTPRLIIFVDELDVVRSLPFSTDEFFAAIRECYNRRTEDPKYRRLTFCLLGVATPSDLIRDTRLTPFNIGQRIELRDFTTTEAAPLARGLEGKEQGAGNAERLLERVLYWTNGHPYLTQRLCQALAGDGKVTGAADVDRSCESLFLTTRAR